MDTRAVRSPLSRVAVVALTVVALVVLYPPSAHAADLHVPGDYPTIQAAIDAAVNRDRVLVDPGTYPENLDFHRKDIVITSTQGPAVTVLHPHGGTGVVIGPAGTFQRFTITGAVDSFGAGMNVSGSGTIIRANIFDGNTESAGGFGAAIGGNSASPTVNGNVFRNNACDSQFLSGVVAFVNDSSPRITNNIVKHNPCRGIDMTLPFGAMPLVANNTIVDNPVGIHVDRRIQTNPQVYRNNIITSNGIGLEVVFGSESNNPTWDHNLVFGNGTNYSGIQDQTGMNGNISAPPQFVAPSVDDYHLRSSSPAVDAGAIVAGLTDDFDGKPRPVDGNRSGTAEYDMGAFEFQPPVRG